MAPYKQRLNTVPYSLSSFENLELKLELELELESELKSELPLLSVLSLTGAGTYQTSANHK